MDLTGTKIFNYRITRLIGEGGMAKVYAAVHQKFENREVAIKILDPVLTANAEIRQRFENEAKIMATLDHPNIVRVIDYTDEGDKLAIIMEYLRGQTLSDYIKRNGAMNPQVAAKLMTLILNAFQYAHDHGIIHRDVKPSNIFLDQQLVPKIMDFGIAKLLTVDVNMTRTGTQMGTPTYMSPEQVRDVKEIDRRSDIYSLGVTLYFMLSGAAPYSTSTLSTFDIYNKIVHEPLPPLSKAIEYNGVVVKATAKKPEDRYPDCNAMAAEFKMEDERLKPAEVNDDDEKTLIFTENAKPKETSKETGTKPSPPPPTPKPAKQDKTPSKTESKPAPKAPKPEPVPKLAEVQPKGEKKGSKKKFIMIAAILVVAVLTGLYFLGTSDSVVVLTDSNDSLSYSYGVVEGHYLTQKFDTVLLPSVKKGIMNAAQKGTPSLPDQKIMFKYSKNNLKNGTFNKEECSVFFEKYGTFLYTYRNRELTFDLDNRLFWAGINHSVSGKVPEISFTDAVKYSTIYPASRTKADMKQNIADEKQFFASLARQSSIRKAENGVLFEVLNEGFNYAANPAPEDLITLSIVIKDLNNKELFRNERKVVTPQTCFPGLKNVLLKMKKGANFRIYVPSDQAYGSIGIDDEIPPYQALICDVYWPDSLF